MTVTGKYINDQKLNEWHEHQLIYVRFVPDDHFDEGFVTVTCNTCDKADRFITKRRSSFGSIGSYMIHVMQGVEAIARSFSKMATPTAFCKVCGWDKITHDENPEACVEEFQDYEPHEFQGVMTLPLTPESFEFMINVLERGHDDFHYMAGFEDNGVTSEQLIEFDESYAQLEKELGQI